MILHESVTPSNLIKYEHRRASRTRRNPSRKDASQTVRFQFVLSGCTGAKYHKPPVVFTYCQCSATPCSAGPVLVPQPSFDEVTDMKRRLSGGARLRAIVLAAIAVLLFCSVSSCYQLTSEIDEDSIDRFANASPRHHIVKCEQVHQNSSCYSTNACAAAK